MRNARESIEILRKTASSRVSGKNILFYTDISLVTNPDVQLDDEHESLLGEVIRECIENENVTMLTALTIATWLNSIRN